MALNFPATPISGDTYTDENQAVWRFDGVKWDVITSTAKKVFIGARVVLGSDFALTTTPTAISGGVTAVVPFDTGNFFRQATPTRIYAPENGFYRVNIILIASNVGSGASYTVSLKRNGTQTYTTNTFGANQNTFFDEILQLNKDDYVEVYVNDLLGSGFIMTGSHIEINLIGYTVGTGISSYDAFSGARTNITTNFSTTSTATAVTWTGTDYDQNANVLGSTYWNSLSPTRLTIKVTGYYRIKCFVETSNNGTTNSYTINLKKNNTASIDSINMSANDFILLNQLIQLSANDYIELFVSNSQNVGSLSTETYIELSRVGV